MPAKTWLFILSIVFFAFKCKLDKDPFPTVYRSIESSKRNNAFIGELQPNSHFLKIEGKNYYIKQAWLEHSHLERNVNDIPTLNICVVITLKYEPNTYLDFHSYVKELGNGQDRIWYNVSSEEFKKDTFSMYYRETVGAKEKNKVFLFYKK